MVRLPRSPNGVMPAVRCFLSFFFICALGIPGLWAAETPPNAELEGILQKMESRNYRWIAIRSDVLVFFAKANNTQAMCGGELLYQRLDERMLLSCVDSIGERVFEFRTLDRRFDLYLPSQKTLYHGSIFDLEGSPDIESHLKARDLYRALKPLAVDPRHAKIERNNSAITSLEVFSARNGEETLARKLLLTPEGDVRGEVYFDAAGRPATEIQRYDFREIPGRAGSFHSIIYPKKITVISPETQKGTALFFSKVTALDTIDPLEFRLRVPAGTKEVFLDEKKLSSTPTKVSVTAVPTPAPVVEKIPVYYAKPREVPEEKIAKIARPPARKEEKKPAAKPPIIAATTVREDKTASAEADIVVEAPPSSPKASAETYDQSTLDPSVDPSV